MPLLASVIISTYNRCASLQAALASLAAVEFPRDQMEVIVVDNNSSDDTPEVVRRAALNLPVKYVAEPRLSWARARQTGAESAAAPYLLYVDDDVTVTPAWLGAVVAAFEADSTVGVVGGPIRPVFEVPPPAWVVESPGLFNGLSLWERKPVLHETHGAPGPNLAVRRACLDEVGGFPPDTLGVDDANHPGTVRRIFVGNGDYGLCLRIRRAGYKVVYAPGAAVYHHIPAARLTKEWWRARLAGEAYMDAFVDWREHSRALPLLVLRLLWRSSRRTAIMGARAALNLLTGRHWIEMLDFQWAYVKARAQIQLALLRHPDVGDRLWNIAVSGVQPADIHQVLEMLPGRR